MNEINTTLGKRSNSDSVPVGLKQLVTDQVKQAQAALDLRDPGAARHIAALRAFDDSLGERGPHPTDPRMYALWLQQGAQGTIDNFTPGEMQTNLLARMGTWGPAPDPDVTLNEFVAAGIEDLIAALQKKIGDANRLRDEAVEEARQKAADADRAAILEQELTEAREQVDGLSGELAEAKGTVTYLTQMGIGEQQAKPRRIKVEGETGIYFYETSFGREFEVIWTVDGKQKTAKAGPDLQAAIALRAELVAAEQTEEVAA